MSMRSCKLQIDVDHRDPNRFLSCVREGMEDQELSCLYLTRRNPRETLEWLARPALGQVLESRQDDGAVIASAKRYVLLVSADAQERAVFKRKES